MENRTILLVEDNPDDILLIQRTFNKTKLSEKFDLKIAQDGNQAFSYLKMIDNSSSSKHNNIPMILLLDLKLPKINGFEILQSIRRNQKTRLLPVIVFTSSKEDQDVMKSYKLGANSYVRKPVDSEKFATVLKQIVTYWCEVNELPVQ